MGTRPAAAEVTELERRLNEARAGGRRLFVPYLTAGLPSPQRFVDLLSELATCADAIEVGIPFSDPVMDGPVITAASTRALEAGIGVDRCFDLIRDARRYAGGACGRRNREGGGRRRGGQGGRGRDRGPRHHEAGARRGAGGGWGPGPGHPASPRHEIEHEGNQEGGRAWRAGVTIRSWR